MNKDILGTVYLIHFDQPLYHAKHYLGWTDNLISRLDCHQNESGSKLMRAIKLNNISWSCVRTWDNVSRSFERSLKNRKNSPKLCPVCSTKITATT